MIKKFGKSPDTVIFNGNGEYTKEEVSEYLKSKSIIKVYKQYGDPMWI